jgi:long-subunit fatty acid transport protein
MQLYKNIMIKYLKYSFAFILIAFALNVSAQSTATTSSPYSRYGLGTINEALLPQTRAMGGISAGINKIGSYNTVNVMNPASYSKINLTTIDVGVYANIIDMSKTGVPNQKDANFRLSHVAFAIPVSKRSAFSFGLMPYSELGYNYKQTAANFGTSLPSDTNSVNYIYSGDGGLSKAHIGYGFGIGKHISIGANVSYIFGDLKQFRSTEVPNLYGTINSRIEESNGVGGLNYDYGIQYSIDFSETKHLTFGYSASAGTKLNTQNRFIVSQYFKDVNGNEDVAIDTVTNQQNENQKIQLPQMNHFGVSYQSDNKFLIGADYSNSKWSKLSIAGTNAGLQNSESFKVGGQITPNFNALNSYLALIDYRLGFRYDKTYLKLNSTDIKQYALTMGFGFPLPRSYSAFYKINFSAELGQRGTTSNNLIKEKFYNFHLGFTLNDKWFTRYKFD